MRDEKLIFNILTFNWPTEPVTMYFTDQETDRSQKLHFTLFPNDAESIFPDLVRNGNNFLYTTFTGEAEGFKPLSIDFEKENQDLIKRYYNRQLNFYFISIQKQIVKVGFIKENQIWIKSQFGSNTKWNIYEKFSVKVQLSTVSKYPEMVAEMLPHFDGNEIPVYGKGNLWFFFKAKNNESKNRKC